MKQPPPNPPDDIEMGVFPLTQQRPPYDEVPWGCIPGCLVEFGLALLIISAVWPVMERHLHGSDLQARLAHLLPVFGLPAIITGGAAFMVRKSRPNMARGFAISAIISVVLGVLVFLITQIKS